ncbi:MAG TPA: glycosyltransferase [Candidatus Xenobia bacterium]|jgi:glycosyltransferase involved in cell wall biosynthesis
MNFEGKLTEQSPADDTLAEQPRAVSLSVLCPVYNERHLVLSSIQRVLEVSSPLISRVQVIVVDDGSQDGTQEVLAAFKDDARVQVLTHPVNQGRGAAIRTALKHATGDVCVVHDADLEYNPADIPALLGPFLNEGADAVFGSRYIAGASRGALMWRHSLLNRGLALLTSFVTDLDLTDVKTCYKAVNSMLLKSLPLHSHDFSFDIELTMKLAKRRARIYEVPIRYSPRSYEEGKKSRPADGLSALTALIRYSIYDDIYQADAYGSHILNELQHARRFNKWMGETLLPHLGDRVLEIGAGVGNLTNQFIPRMSYVASDINPHYLQYLKAYSVGKPYLKVKKIDVTCPEDFAGLKEFGLDTALMVNVLEHVSDEIAALKNLYDVLSPGGKAVILVPQHPLLYGSMDAALEHRERYTQQHLRQSLTSAGFVVERIFDFNRGSVPGWMLNGQILKRKTFARSQLKALEMLTPLLRRIDRVFPWSGLSIIGVGVKPAP